MQFCFTMSNISYQSRLACFWFRDQVEQITMGKNGLLEFTFTDGHTENAEYSTKRKAHPWSDEQRAKFRESIKGTYTPERRKAMSEHMKQVRREKKWPNP